MTRGALGAHPGIAAPWWPRLVQLLPLELILVMAIAGLTISLCVANAPAARFKAQFTEVLAASISHRMALAEHMALTGTWEGLEEEAGNIPSTQGSGSAMPRTHGEISGGIVTLHSRAPGHGNLPVRVVFRPALATNDLPWTSLWLCGAGEPPEGWIAPTLADPHNLPEIFLLSNCREGKSR